MFRHTRSQKLSSYVFFLSKILVPASSKLGRGGAGVDKSRKKNMWYTGRGVKIPRILVKEDPKMTCTRQLVHTGAVQNTRRHFAMKIKSKE